MTRDEQIYALFVEANPFPDIESLPETFEEARVPLHAVGVVAETDTAKEVAIADRSGVPKNSPRRGRYVAVAAAIVILLGVGALLGRSLGTSTPPASENLMADLTPAETAVEFIARLDSGDVDGAQALLTEPIGMIWFIPIGRVSDTSQVRDYLEFYAALGMDTEISSCLAEGVGPLTNVTCDATQSAGALSSLGLEFPPFEMTFTVRDGAIQLIGFDSKDSQAFARALSQSRFVQFRSEVLRALDLVQNNGDPVWSRENGELLPSLINDFVSQDS
jgi:hypothetical protein